MGGASGGVASMHEGIAAAAQAPPTILRKVRRLPSMYCIVMTDQLEIKDGPGRDESGTQSAQREASPAALQDSRERRLVHAVLDGHFDRILILSPICPRDLR